MLLPKKKKTKAKNQLHKNLSPRFSFRDDNGKMIPSYLSFTYLVEV